MPIRRWRDQAYLSRSLGGIELCSLILLNPAEVGDCANRSLRFGAARLTAEVLEPADLCSYGTSFRRPVPLVGRLRDDRPVT
jgi:hypothetical protein